MSQYAITFWCHACAEYVRIEENEGYVRCVDCHRNQLTMWFTSETDIPTYLLGENDWLISIDSPHIEEVP